jgi:hypothetical protein
LLDCQRNGIPVINVVKPTTTTVTTTVTTKAIDKSIDKVLDSKIQVGTTARTVVWLGSEDGPLTPNGSASLLHRLDMLCRSHQYSLTLDYHVSPTPATTSKVYQILHFTPLSSTDTNMVAISVRLPIAIIPVNPHPTAITTTATTTTTTNKTGNFSVVESTGGVYTMKEGSTSAMTYIDAVTLLQILKDRASHTDIYRTVISTSSSDTIRTHYILSFYLVPQPQLQPQHTSSTTSNTCTTKPTMQSVTPNIPSYQTSIPIAVITSEIIVLDSSFKRVNFRKQAADKAGKDIKKEKNIPVLLLNDDAHLVLDPLRDDLNSVRGQHGSVEHSVEQSPDSATTTDKNRRNSDPIIIIQSK